MKIEKIKWEPAKTYKNIQDAINNVADIQFFWIEPKPGVITEDNFASKFDVKTLTGEGKPTITDNLLEIRLFTKDGGVHIVKNSEGYKAAIFTIGTEGEEVISKPEKRILNGKQLVDITVYYDKKTAQPVAWKIDKIEGGNNE